MMAFNDFHIKAFVTKDLGSHSGKLKKHIHNKAHVGRKKDGNLVGRRQNLLLLFECVAGCGHDQWNFPFQTGL